MSNTNTVLIIGAGVDKTQGIDMPLAVQLVPEIARFAEEEGREVEQTIRSFLPGLRFSFNRFIKEAIDSITRADENQMKNIATKLEEKIKEVEEEKDKKLAELLIKLFEKIKTIQEGGKLDGETLNLIKEVFGEEIIAEIEDESIIEFTKLSFSDSFKIVMKKVLKQSLKEPENPVYSVLSTHFLDIETLLVETFLGFYNEKLPDIKKYLYISWMLWAYLKAKENNILSDINENSIPFYSRIPQNFKVISFNYTTFLSKVVKKDNHIYFHGTLNQYLRMDLRDLIDIEETSLNDVNKFLKEIIKPNIELERNRYVIPGIIPPLKLKPVLSNRFIELWYKASSWIKEADKVIIIGYSFNYADEHFNDILRTNRVKQIYIINPSPERLRERLSKIFGFREEDFTNTRIQNKSAFNCKNIHIIEGKAHEIDLGKL